MALLKVVQNEVDHKRLGARNASIVFSDDTHVSDSVSNRPARWALRGKPTPVSVTLVDLVDAFIGQAGPEAYAVLSHGSIEISSYDFHSDIDVGQLDADSNFRIIKSYAGQTFGLTLSDQCVANLVLKILIDFHSEKLDNFLMSSNDKKIIDRIANITPPLTATFPKRRVGQEQPLVECSQKMNASVPASLRNIYENSVAWKTAKAKEVKTESDLPQGEVLKGFSLL